MYRYSIMTVVTTLLILGLTCSIIADVFDCNTYDDVRSLRKTALQPARGFDPEDPTKDFPSVPFLLPLEIECVGSEGTDGAVGARLIDSVEDYRSETTLHFDAWAQWPSIKVETTMDWDLVFDSSSDSAILDITARIEYGDKRIVQPTIDPEFAALTQEEFERRFGKYYVSRWTEGSLFAVRYRYHNLTQDELSDLRTFVAADITAQGGAAAALDLFHQKLSRLSQVEWDVTWVGVPANVVADVIAAVGGANAEESEAGPSTAGLVDALHTLLVGADASWGKPIRFYTTEYPDRDFPYTGYRLQKAYLKEYLKEKERLGAMIKRIDELFQGEQACMILNITEEERNHLAVLRTKLRKFVDLVIVKLIGSCESANLSDLEDVRAKCASGRRYEKYVRALEIFAQNPPKWPVQLFDDSTWTFCQWCNRKESTSITEGNKRLILKMMEQVGVPSDSFDCLRAQFDLVQEPALDLRYDGEGPRATSADIVASLANVDGEAGNSGSALEALNLEGQDIRSLVPFRLLENLRHLRLTHNAGIISLAPLYDFADLESFHLTGNNERMLEIEDWSPLEALVGLSEIEITHSNLPDTFWLRDMWLLEKAALHDNVFLNSLDGLRNALFLTYLSIQYNPSLDQERALDELVDRIRTNIEFGFYDAWPAHLANDPELRQRFWQAAERYFRANDANHAKQVFAQVFKSRNGCTFCGLCPGGVINMNDYDYDVDLGTVEETMNFLHTWVWADAWFSTGESGRCTWGVAPTCAIILGAIGDPTESGSPRCMPVR